MAAHRPPATVLAFDFGTRRIGVAIGNTLTRSARPLTTIVQRGSDSHFAAITALIDEWQPERLVVGIPVHADGTPHAMTRQAQRFAQTLSECYGLPVSTADERHTTQAAQAALDVAGAGRGGRAARDEIAAQIILQGWLDDDGRTDS